MYLLTFFFKSGFFCKRNFKRKTRSSRVLHLDNFLQNFSQLFTLYVLLSCCWLPSDASVLSLLGYDNAVIVPQCDPLNLCSECYWHSCVFTEQADIVNGTACVTECTLILCYYDQDFVLSSVGVSGVWIWNSIENIGNYCLFFFWILFWKKKKPSGTWRFCTCKPRGHFFFHTTTVNLKWSNGIHTEASKRQKSGLKFDIAFQRILSSSPSWKT